MDNNLKYINSFRFWCNKILPLVYDESLSYYELLCKVIDYLNTVVRDGINVNQEAISNLLEQLTALKLEFENMDISQAVSDKIDEMAESGQLEALFGSDIWTNATPKVGADLLSVEDIGYFPNDGYIQQGGCLTPDNKFMIVRSDDNGNTGNAIFYEFSLATKQIIRTFTATGGNHWNSLTYHDGYIYAASRDHIIIKIDYNDGTIADRIDIGTCYCTGIDYDNGFFWIYDNLNDCIWRGTTLSALEIYIQSVPDLSAQAQGSAVKDNYMYIASYDPNRILVVDLASKSIFGYININDFQTERVIISELKDLDFDANGNLYFAAAYNQREYTQRIESVSFIGHINVFDNSVNKNARASSDSSSVYVKYPQTEYYIAMDTLATHSYPLLGMAIASAEKFGVGIMRFVLDGFTQPIAEDISGKIYVAITSAANAVLKGGRFSNMDINFAAAVTISGALRFEHCYVKFKELNAGDITATRIITALDSVLWMNAYTGALTNELYLSDTVGHFSNPVTPLVVCKANGYTQSLQRRLFANLSSNPMCLEAARHIIVMEETGKFWEWRGTPLPNISQASTQRFACGDESKQFTFNNSNNAWTISTPGITPLQVWWE